MSDSRYQVCETVSPRCFDEFCGSFFVLLLRLAAGEQYERPLKNHLGRLGEYLQGNDEVREPFLRVWDALAAREPIEAPLEALCNRVDQKRRHRGYAFAVPTSRSPSTVDRSRFPLPARRKAPSTGSAPQQDASTGAVRRSTSPQPKRRTGQRGRRREDTGPPAGVEERRAPVPGRRRSDVLKPQCPFCGSCESVVYRSVGQYVRDDRYRRRRRCLRCFRTWPTIEHLDVVQFAKDLSKLGQTMAALGIEPNLDAAEALAFVRDLVAGRNDRHGRDR